MIFEPNHVATSNPTVTRSNGVERDTTEPLRNLFSNGVFNEPRTYHAWEKDRADLVLLLVKWAIVLWECDWTEDICCSGIRCVKNGMGENIAMSLHTLGTCQCHESMVSQIHQDLGSHQGFQPCDHPIPSSLILV